MKLTFKLDTKLFQELYQKLGGAIKDENIANIIENFDTIDAILRVKSEKYNLGKNS